MKIKNIEELKKSINKSTIIIFVAIFSAAMIGLAITHSKFLQKQALLNDQEIVLAEDVFKSNLSEKLSIIASSTEFIDYLRSGQVTRKEIYPQFLAQISTLQSKSIAGISIFAFDGSSIFNIGSTTSNFVILKLCYMNQTLDSNMGDCKYNLKLYFNSDKLIQNILSINKAIKICQNCKPYSLIDSNYFGSFPISKKSNLELNLYIDKEKDYFFYVYFILMVISLFIFGSWSWYRLSSLLSNYISTPIKKLTSCLKTNEPLANQEDNIEEIQYLIEEIDSWKLQLNKIQSDENASKMAKIAAQLAHDVRSPLTAIEMLVKNITNIPENCKFALYNATQRISDIANNFLLQYKKPQSFNYDTISNEYIPNILEKIISEKRTQYADNNIKIFLIINDNAWDTFALINAVEFYRILSNLINNSIEAISDFGLVTVKLIKFNKYFRVEITDNGSGIPSDLLPKILDGGVSLGKKNGSGLGLSHAIKKVEEWQGDIDIKSQLEKGTTVGINLPSSNKTPPWFQSHLSFISKPIICILDNESFAHGLWSQRLKNTNNFISKIVNFFNIKDAHDFILNTQNSNVVYLVDYDLGIDEPNGVDFILKYNLQKIATLVTNRHDDLKVQEKCTELNIKILPKSLIPYIPIYNM